MIDTPLHQDALKRSGSRWSKFHREAAGPDIAPKLLAKQHLNVWLVINYENKEVHGRSPIWNRGSRVRQNGFPV